MFKRNIPEIYSDKLNAYVNTYIYVFTYAFNSFNSFNQHCPSLCQGMFAVQRRFHMATTRRFVLKLQYECKWKHSFVSFLKHVMEHCTNANIHASDTCLLLVHVLNFRFRFNFAHCFDRALRSVKGHCGFFSAPKGSGHKLTQSDHAVATLQYFKKDIYLPFCMNHLFDGGLPPSGRVHFYRHR